MFHEDRDVVTKLKTSDMHFKKIFDKHNHLHDEISKVEEGGHDHINPLEIEKMKKEKLLLKDEIYSLIVKYKNNNK
jgi:uncharacterized protein YdcH (DUF465 family)